MGNDPSYTNQDFKVIGSRVKRPDGVDKVTGRAKYGADHNAPGQLVGLFLRSPHAHARIVKIATARAEKLSGVKAVITSADLPDLTNGDAAARDILENCMARGRALYDGHAVAAVAAVDEQTAKKALKLIEVSYEVLPHVTDVDEALKPDAPVIHEDMYTAGVDPRPSRPSICTTCPSSATATWRRVLPGPMSSLRKATKPSRPTRAISSRMPAWPASAPTALANCG